MNRIHANLGFVLGSAGIAALTIAILLVPYSDLSAAANAPTPCAAGCIPAYNNGCICNGTCLPTPPCACSASEVDRYTIPGDGTVVICKCFCPLAVP